jgi:hypothetical protein
MDLPALRSGLLQERAGRARTQIRALDNCLGALEDLAEAGTRSVSPSTIDTLPLKIPGIRPGMPIPAAIELVFSEQAKYGVGPQIGTTPAETNALDETAARTLTESIRAGVGHLSLLVMEAHDRRAWAALGHAGWSAYVEHELGFSRSRSYELIEHGRVLRRLMDATGAPEPPSLTPYAAGQIKPHLDRVINEITQLIRPTMNHRDILTLMEPILIEARSSLNSKTRRATGTVTRKPIATSKVDDEVLTSLAEAIRLVLQLPAPAKVISCLSDVEYERWGSLMDASTRLQQIASLWQRQVDTRESRNSTSFSSTESGPARRHIGIVP